MSVDVLPPEAPHHPPPEGDREEAAARRTRQERIMLGVGLAVLVLVALALAERVAYLGDVLPHVQVAGVDLGGATEPGAARRLAARAAVIERAPVTVRAGNTTLRATPRELGLRIDPGASVRAARRDGRRGGPVAQVVGLLARRLRPDRRPLVVQVDEHRFGAALDSWLRRSGQGLRDGALRFEGTRVVEVAPRRGRGLDIGEVRAAILGAVGHGYTRTIALPLRSVDPPIDARAVRRAAERVRRLLRAPVTLTAGGVTVRVTPGQLASTLSTRVGATGLEVTIDEPRLRTVLGSGFSALETPAQDATWSTDGTHATVVPSRDGHVLDLAAAADRILDGRRRVRIGFRTSTPARTTEQARALGITHRVSTFTTSYPCCEPRVTNLHLAARTIDGTVVPPGATFSLNAALGPRTRAKGYVPAPAIGADLELEDAVGGGVSQLSTTLFNAVFFGGYQDVTHTVHSLYISRYPMGREATLNYPSIDNKFRNDTRHGVLIRTAVTATSITVSLYGDADGRTVKAVGPTILQTIPPTVSSTDDPTLPAGTEKVLSPGATGYVVENDRIIDRPGRAEVTQRFVEHYQMRPTKVARGTGPAPVPPAEGGTADGTGGPSSDIPPTTVPPDGAPSPAG